jgi:hypothetical protein
MAYKTINGINRWIEVVPREAGRTPSTNIDNLSWLRLDLIEQIFITPTIAISDDKDEWEYSIVVTTHLGHFHPSTVLHTLAKAKEIVDEILTSVARAKWE